jgi:transposase
MGCVARVVRGRLPKLSRDQLAQLEVESIKGAEANGCPNDVWTLQRVAEAIERVSGVSYHPAHVWSILRHELKWRWQPPAPPASERWCACGCSRTAPDLLHN